MPPTPTPGPSLPNPGPQAGSQSSHTDSCPMHAGDAYSECLKTDHMVSLICHHALGRTQSGAKLEQQLQEVTDGVVIPKMPETAAVLQRIAASDDHPGAIYRLAGDRCAQTCSQPAHNLLKPAHTCSNPGTKYLLIERQAFCLCEDASLGTMVRQVSCCASSEKAIQSDNAQTMVCWYQSIAHDRQPS